MGNRRNLTRYVSVFSVEQCIHTVTVESGGIDTNSKQYKAVIQQMTKDGCTGSMFTCVQAIKNLMKNYNSSGEWVEPTTGLTGLLVTDETGYRIALLCVARIDVFRAQALSHAAAQPAFLNHPNFLSSIINRELTSKFWY